MTTDLRIDAHHDHGVAVVAPHGVLDAASYSVLRTSLVKASIDEPRAVIVDLAGLRVPNRAALALFYSVSDQLAQWPGVPLLLVADHGEQRTMLDSHRMGRYVPVYSSVSDATAAIDVPPPRRVARRALPNTMASARLARQFVLAMCAEWQQDARAADAVTIANELVENTLLHTYCAPTLRLELRRGMLTVAVYDDDPAPARLAVSPRGTSRRRGLLLVERMSKAWGCSPTPMGGKVVWAVL